MESTDPPPIAAEDTTTATAAVTATTTTDAVVETSESESHFDNWGTMGLGGDTSLLVDTTAPPPPSGTNPTSSMSSAPVLPYQQQQQLRGDAYASTASVFGAESQQHHQQQQPPTPQQQPSDAGGSITRFVPDPDTASTYVSPFAKPTPPPPMSYAQRSQQAHIVSGAVTPSMATTTTTTTPPRMYGSTIGTPIAVTGIPVPPNTTLYQQQQQQQHPRVVGGTYPTINTMNNVSTTINSSMLSRPQQQPQAVPPMTMTATAVRPSPPQQQYPVAGSYAARSAAAAAAVVVGVQQYGQQHPTMLGSSGIQPPSAVPTTQTQYGYPQPQYGNNIGSGSSGSVMSTPQQPQQQHMVGPQSSTMANSTYMNRNMNPNSIPVSYNNAAGGNSSIASMAALVGGNESVQYQQKLLTDSIRKVQEHAHYMKQAMDQNNIAVTLDRAAHMVGELGGPPHGHPTTSVGGGQNASSSSGAPSNTGGSAKLTPKNYYDLYMRALEDMPLLEEYLYNLAVPSIAAATANVADPALTNNPGIGMIRIVDDSMSAATRNSSALQPNSKYTMKQLYECVQYFPRVVSRLYLQITVGSALIRSKECTAKYVINDLQTSIRCEQNPVRGLFVRYFLITALRDKLPDTPIQVESVPTPPPTTVPAVTSDVATTDGIVVDSSNAVENCIENKDADIDHDASTEEEGTVKDSYEFLLANFMEMNKLWVRIQHLPGEGKDKEARKRRERERNDLRILVGTNLVRLSQLECVTSKIYGENILPYILEHIVTTGDPLSQAYIMDCLVQVFPDEFHIETLPILLNVCPRLRDKVNIRTILQGLMDRLAKYLADGELLDESDTNQVKISLARDSFGLFEECVQKVYNARGPKLTSKEVIRLQTALLQYSIKCFPGYVEQVGRCIDSCVTALQQANASYDANAAATISSTQNGTNRMIGGTALDDVSVAELEKLLSIPLDTLDLKVLEFDTYSRLISFLPWQNRREVAISLLKAVENSGSIPKNIKDIEQLFHVIEPLVRDEHLRGDVSSGNPHMQQHLQSGMMPSMDLSRQKKVQDENYYIAALIQTLDHDDTDIVYEMLQLAKRHLTHDLSGPDRTVFTLSALVFAALRLANRVASNEEKASGLDVPSVLADEAVVDPQTSNEEKGENITAAVDDTSDLAADKSTLPKAKYVTVRNIFAMVQDAIAIIGKHDFEKGVKLYIDASTCADRIAYVEMKNSGDGDFGSVSYELIRLAMTLYEDRITDPKCQCRCVTSFSGSILALRAVSKENYESLITRTAQFAAKIMLKPEQSQLVALCAHLFYPADSGGQKSYSNPQRALECLQRSLKLADACTKTNPIYVSLFVDLLEHYVYFFEKNNPMITHAYISGLIALINEHLNSLNAVGSDKDAKSHFVEVIRYIKKRKTDSDVAEMFSHIQIL